MIESNYNNTKEVNIYKYIEKKGFETSLTLDFIKENNKISKIKELPNFIQNLISEVGC